MASWSRARSPSSPTLIYLGRLKQYKRIDRVLDTVAALPEGTLDIVGDGDQREALEQEVVERGLGDRVTFHGHVSEEEKQRLLARSWLALTASSAEGWCLSVVEAGACRTPTAALRVGGLSEVIVDDQTGLLADEPEELVEGVRELLADRPRLEAYSDAALARAESFTWDTTAGGMLEVMEQAEAVHQAGRTRLRSTFRASESGKAAGLAGATLLNNAIQLIFTIVFTRLLGASGYGSLAALISTFLVLHGRRPVHAGRGRARGGHGSPGPSGRDAAHAAGVDGAIARRARRGDRGLDPAARAAGRPDRGVRPPLGRRRHPAHGRRSSRCSRCSAARCRACGPTARSA